MSYSDEKRKIIRAVEDKIHNLLLDESIDEESKKKALQAVLEILESRKAAIPTLEARQ